MPRFLVFSEMGGDRQFLDVSSWTATLVSNPNP